MIGPYLIACGLLVLAGLSKAARPGNTVRALAQVFPYPRLVAAVVPILAVGELTLGAAAIVWPIPVFAAAVSASYVGFAGFVVVIRLRHGALSSCGCFGTPDTPATWLHVVINVFLAASSAVIALDEPVGNIVTVLRSQPLHGIPLLLAVGVGMWLVVLAFSSLAQLTAVRRTLVDRVEGSSS
jgi:energy-converting hydrogenase Eha subunit C